MEQRAAKMNYYVRPIDVPLFSFEDARLRHGKYDTKEKGEMDIKK